MKFVVPIVIFLALTLRVSVFLANPTGNSFDDHLSNIHIYYTEGSSPKVNSGWQSYQPPIYYHLSAFVLKGAALLNLDLHTGWKMVQFISCLSSIISFIAIVIIIKTLFGLGNNASIIGLSLYAIYPRELYISGFSTNDSLLYLFGTICILSFIKANQGNRTFGWVVICCLCAFLASWTKQSGLAFLMLPALIILSLLFNWLQVDSENLPYKFRIRLLLICILTIVASVLDEFWRWQETGLLLASNQHFFPEYTMDQLPGKLSDISFFKFPIIELLDNPFISNETLYSFPAEFFARHWFDYEPRYLVLSWETLILARTLFLVGLATIPIIAIGMFRSAFDRKQRLMAVGLFGVFFAFLAVPLIQTARFPYFSSMKATFSLPSMSIYLIFFTYGFTFLFSSIKRDALIYISVICLFIIGGLHVLLIYSQAAESTNQPNRPQWNLPIF